MLAAAWRRWWPLPAAVVVVAAGFGFAAIFHDIAPRTHWFASDLPYQEAQAKAKGPLPKGSGLDTTVSLGEPSIRSHLDSLRDGIDARSSTTRRATGSATRARPRSASA